MDENLIGNILGSLINRDNDCGMGGGNGAWWIIILLLFFTGGFGGFGMNRGMAAPATQQDVAAGFNFNQLDNGIRGLERGMCQLGYDNLAQTNGVNMNISAQGNNIQSAITQVGYQAQQCCCETNRNIDSLKAQMSEDTCKITTIKMIEAYGTNITATQNMNVPFANKVVQTNCAVVKDNNNETFELLMPGVYNVSFHGVATTTAAGNVSFQLLADGVVLPQTVVSATTGAGDIATVSFETNVRVAVAPMIQKAKFTVQYTGSAGTIDMADIIIRKVR